MPDVLARHVAPDSVRAVLFDLDGTLADTAPDLGAALNDLRRTAGLDALPLETIRPWVSQGGRGLIRGGFDLSHDDPALPSLLDALLARYAIAVCVHTRLFPGMDGVLDELESRGLAWGIVTNKPSRFTRPLLEGLDLAQRAGSVVCGDTLAARKPDPAPVLLACTQLGVAPASCVMVGDDRRDIAAARAAGAQSLAVTYGYGTQDDPPEDWSADGLLHTPADLLHWLDQTP
ncbi:MAG TPA: phosphoglycolate phosphatase [Candidatus Acidoferrales bacterium]|nr:phosphoglycolate phosphatase [Candidatus Acidoferrales bacterium]